MNTRYQFAATFSSRIEVRVCMCAAREYCFIELTKLPSNKTYESRDKSRWIKSTYCTGRLVSIDNIMFSLYSAAQRAKWLQSKLDDPNEGKRSASNLRRGELCYLVFYAFFLAKCDFFRSQKEQIFLGEFISENV